MLIDNILFNPTVTNDTNENNVTIDNTDKIIDNVNMVTPCPFKG